MARLTADVHPEVARLDGGLELDLLAGGMPCQSFSHAGKREGLKDPRGELLLEFAELIRRWRPRAFLVENVRGLATHDGGKTLDVVLATLGLPSSSGPDEYVVSHRLLDASEHGVPQKRERIFIVGFRRDVFERIGAPFEFPERVEPKGRTTVRHAILDPRRPVPPSKGMRYSAAKAALFSHIPPGGCWVDLPTEQMKKDYMKSAYFASGGRRGILKRLAPDKPAPTLMCNPQAKQSERCHPFETRPLTVREYARIQTFPDDHAFCGSVADQYKQIGNAVPVRLARVVGEAIARHLARENRENREKRPKTQKVRES